MDNNNLTFLVIEGYSGNGWFCFVPGFLSFVLFPSAALFACPFDRMYALKPKNPE